MYVCRRRRKRLYVCLSPPCTYICMWWRRRETGSKGTRRRLCAAYAAMYQQAADFIALRPCLGTSFVRQRASSTWRRHVFFSCSPQRLISGSLLTGFATVKPETIDMHAHMYVCVVWAARGWRRCSSVSRFRCAMFMCFRSATSSFAAHVLT